MADIKYMAGSQKTKINKTNSTRAFTLIEDLLVVVIITLVAAIVTPMFGGVDVARLDAAGRLVIADIEFARTRSLGTAADHCVVVFDVPGNTYRLALESDPSTPITNPVTGDPYQRWFGEGLAAGLEGVSLDSVSLGGDDKLVFGSDGAPDQLTDAEVNIAFGASVITILVDSDLGRATIMP